jgi:hypothetical protein
VAEDGHRFKIVFGRKVFSGLRVRTHSKSCWLVSHLATRRGTSSAQPASFANHTQGEVSQDKVNLAFHRAFFFL